MAAVPGPVPLFFHRAGLLGAGVVKGGVQQVRPLALYEAGFNAVAERPEPQVAGGASGGRAALFVATARLLGEDRRAEGWCPHILAADKHGHISIPRPDAVALDEDRLLAVEVVAEGSGSMGEKRRSFGAFDGLVHVTYPRGLPVEEAPLRVRRF